MALIKHVYNSLSRRLQSAISHLPYASQPSGYRPLINSSSETLLCTQDYASKYATVLNTTNLIFSLWQKMWSTLSKSAIFLGLFLVKTAFLLEGFEVEVVGINRLKG